MGSKSSKSTTSVVTADAEDASAGTFGYFTTDEMVKLEEKFRELGDGETVSKDALVTVLSLPGRMATQLFDALDTDHSGTIDREEYLMAVRLLLRSDEREKLQLLFDMFRHGADTVTREGMRAMVRSAALASLRIIRAAQAGGDVVSAGAATPSADEEPPGATADGGGSGGGATDSAVAGAGAGAGAGTACDTGAGPVHPRLAALKKPAPMTRTDSEAEREEFVAMADELVDDAFAGYDTGDEGLSFEQFAGWVSSNDVVKELMDTVFEVARGSEAVLLGTPPPEDHRPRPLSPITNMYNDV